jgi:ATP-dependent RNA helicase DeaD
MTDRSDGAAISDDATPSADAAQPHALLANDTLPDTDTPEDAARAFGALGLGPDALQAVADLGFTTPTPVQEQAIPALLSGRDLIAQAPTGTGKTAAYGLPIVERLNEGELRPQAVIIVPTRELAIQVAEALHAMGAHRELVTLPIYGGAPYERQFRALKRGVQVVVGTPGRVLDHLGRGTLDLGAVRMVVLDEADEMLDMGFIEDIESILATLPEQRQTALFSATIPPRIARLAEQYQRDPMRVSVATREAVAPRVRQVYYEVPAAGKPEALSRILDLEEPESGIVFVRTRRDADEVAERLNGQGYIAQAIHGEINQAQRERVLDRFRKGHTQLLVATDVAARGLDIPDVSHIINYDLPMDAEGYVHRIGRTGRAGRGGEALTLVTPRERRQLQLIERSIHRRLERLRLPTPADVAARRRAAFREDVLAILDAGQLDPFLALVEDLADSHDPAELAAAAFKLAAQTREAARPGRTDTWAPQTIAAAGTGAGAGAEQEPAVDGEAQQEREPAAPRKAGRRRDEREAVAPPAFAPAGRGRRERAAPVRMARLFLRVGRRDGVRPADLVGAIANEAGLPGDAIGDIDLYDTFSFVEVPQEAAESVLDALNATTIRNRQPRATVARPDDAWGDDGHGRDGRDHRDRDRDRRDDGDFGRPPRRTFGDRSGTRLPAASRARAGMDRDRRGAGRTYGGRAPGGRAPRPGSRGGAPRDR